MVRPLEPHHPPAFFSSGPSPFAKLIFFVALSIAVMAVDSRMQYLAQIRAGFIGLATPLQAIANAPSELYQSMKKQLVSRESLMTEADNLRQQAMQHSMMLQRYKSLEVENARLRQLLLVAQTGPLPSKLAEIVHMGRDPFMHKVTVNLGSANQIVSGQAVIDDKGVVGQVTSVYTNSSEITLITDKTLSIPIQIERNGLRAVAFGHGRDFTLDLPYLPANVDILKDDVLITSGIDGIYPEGLVVAKIASITHQQDSPFAHIVAVPVAGVMNHKQVLLLNIPKAVEVDAKINHEIPKTVVKTTADESKKLAGKQITKPLTKIEAAIGKPSVRPPETHPIVAKPIAVQPATAKPAVSSTLEQNNAPR